MGTLTEREKDILNLAVATYKYPAARERQAQEQFQLSGVLFWQEVNRLIDHPAAYAWNPQLVNLRHRRRIHHDRPRLASRILGWPAKKTYGPGRTRPAPRSTGRANGTGPSGPRPGRTNSGRASRPKPRPWTSSPSRSPG